MNLQFLPKLCAVAFFTIFFHQMGFTQGCVAIRPMSCSMAASNDLGILPKGSFQVTANYQYFKSFRHFRGDVEEHERIENNTQVENFSHALDMGIQYGVTNRLAIGFNLPFLSYKRTSLYEHYGNSIDRNPEQKRFGTESAGIGDMRITANYWLFDPDKKDSKGNLSLGLGLKLPTGNSNVQGEFHRIAINGQDSTFTKAVDQSIQLGDGGWGIILQLQALKKVFKGGLLYANGFYMLNPMTENKTVSRGTIVGVDPIIAYHSIPDQFSFRGGINYQLSKINGLGFSLGGRIEGVPSHDLLGDSNGYRRPGYVVSIEPSIIYSKAGLNFSLSVPYALYRNRVKSVYDLSDPTGSRHGDAAFADYLINFTIAYRFGNQKSDNHKKM